MTVRTRWPALMTASLLMTPLAVGCTAGEPSQPTPVGSTASEERTAPDSSSSESEPTASESAPAEASGTDAERSPSEADESTPASEGPRDPLYSGVMYSEQLEAHFPVDEVSTQYPEDSSFHVTFEPDGTAERPACGRALDTLNSLGESVDGLAATSPVVPGRPNQDIQLVIVRDAEATAMADAWQEAVSACEGVPLSPAHAVSERFDDGRGLTAPETDPAESDQFETADYAALTVHRLEGHPEYLTFMVVEAFSGSFSVEDAERLAADQEKHLIQAVEDHAATH